MSKSFYIETDDHHSVFLPGSIVSGRVIFKNPTPLTVNNIKIKLHGYTATQSPLERGICINSFLKPTLFLLGSSSSSSIVLSASNHSIPFSFTLPSVNLPPSFEGVWGSVRYVLKANICGANVEKETTYQLSVPSTEDISLYMQPISTQKPANAGRFWWKCGFIECEAKIKQKGFYSEDVIPLQLEFKNHSLFGFQVSNVRLQQYNKYTFVPSFTLKPYEFQAPRVEKQINYLYSEKFDCNKINSDCPSYDEPIVPEYTLGMIEGKVKKSIITRTNQRSIKRTLHLTIPSTKEIDSYFCTKLIHVYHVIKIHITSLETGSKGIDLELPITISGFPVSLHDSDQGVSEEIIEEIGVDPNFIGHGGFRRVVPSIEQLPAYTEVPVGIVGR